MFRPPKPSQQGAGRGLDVGGELGGFLEQLCRCFSATGSDPINPMASAVPSQAGRLCVMSAPLLVLGECPQRTGLTSPLPWPGSQDAWILFLLTHSTTRAKP